jgi:hypothetical protein
VLKEAGAGDLMADDVRGEMAAAPAAPASKAKAKEQA